MSTTHVCSKCQWTEADDLLDVLYGTEQSRPITDSEINDWRMNLQACLWLNEEMLPNAVTTLTTGWTNNITTFVKLWYAKILLQFLHNLCLFTNVWISQGSVATYFVRGGNFCTCFVGNIVSSSSEQNCENRSTFGKVIAKNKLPSYLWDIALGLKYNTIQYNIKLVTRHM